MQRKNRLGRVRPRSALAGLFLLLCAALVKPLPADTLPVDNIFVGLADQTVQEKLEMTLTCNAPPPGGYIFLEGSTGKISCTVINDSQNTLAGLSAQFTDGQTPWGVAGEFKYAGHDDSGDVASNPSASADCFKSMAANNPKKPPKPSCDFTFQFDTEEPAGKGEKPENPKIDIGYWGISLRIVATDTTNKGVLAVSNGAPIVVGVKDKDTAAPEPTTLASLSVGLSVLCLCTFRRRH